MLIGSANACMQYKLIAWNSLVTIYFGVHINIQPVCTCTIQYTTLRLYAWNVALIVINVDERKIGIASTYWFDLQGDCDKGLRLMHVNYIRYNRMKVSAFLCTMYVWKRTAVHVCRLCRCMSVFWLDTQLNVRICTSYYNSIFTTMLHSYITYHAFVLAAYFRVTNSINLANSNLVEKHKFK